MDFRLTEEQAMIQVAARNFAQSRIVPIAAEFDASGEFPEATIREMGELGMMGLEVPQEYGGAGLDAIGYTLALISHFDNRRAYEFFARNPDARGIVDRIMDDLVESHIVFQSGDEH